MNYLKFGNSNKYILFLHGWGADLNSFLWIREYFEDEYSLIFVDFDGFGKSNIPDKAFSVSDYVFKIKELLDCFEINSLVIVGHSFGGRVAIKFLFYYQSCYNSIALCLVDSAGILPKRNLIYKLKVKRYKVLKQKLKNKPTDLKLKNKIKDFGSSDYKVLSPIMKQTFINVVNEDLSYFSKYIKCKTLIVWGKEDKETKMFMAKRLHNLIKNSSLVIFKNAGHFSFLEKKEDFVIILDSFIKSL